jgi:hypothetical protein
VCFYRRQRYLLPAEHRVDGSPVEIPPEEKR